MKIEDQRRARVARRAIPGFERLAVFGLQPQRLDVGQSRLRWRHQQGARLENHGALLNRQPRQSAEVERREAGKRDLHRSHDRQLRARGLEELRDLRPQALRNIRAGQAKGDIGGEEAELRAGVIGLAVEAHAEERSARCASSIMASVSWISPPGALLALVKQVEDLAAPEYSGRR